MLQHKEAEVAIQKNTYLEKACNAVIGFMNYFIQKVYPDSQFKKYSREEAMQTIKSRMKTLKDTQQEEALEVEAPLKGNNDFETARHQCQAFIDQEKKELEHIIKEAETNKKLGGAIQKYNAIIRDANNRMNVVRDLEYCLKAIQNTNSENPEDFQRDGSIFAHRALIEKRLRKSRTCEQHAVRLINIIEERSNKLDKPTRIADGYGPFSQNLGKISYLINKQLMMLEHQRDGWFTSKQDKNRASQLIHQLKALKMEVEAYDKSREAGLIKGNPWVPTADDTAFKKLLNKIEVFNQGKNEKNLLVQTLQSFKQQWTPKAEIQASMKEEIHEQRKPSQPPPPSTPAPTTTKE